LDFLQAFSVLIITGTFIMYDIIPSFITAFIISFFAIPSIIKIAVAKNLYDEPDERRSHTERTPSLGGIGIFAGLIFSITYWIPFDTCDNPEHEHIKYVLCAYIIIFLIGAKDDIIPLTPVKKFLGQLLAAFILVYKANIKLSSLYGIFGVYDIPEWISIPLSIFTIIVIINSFNLIDGINALCGTIGIITCIAFGTWFYFHGRLDLAVLAAANVGALMAFLFYNVTPARIFMGDTGSLIVGLTASILSISFIENNKFWHDEWFIESVPAVAIGVLIVPLFDTLRVFILRAMRGKSPFHPDRTHVHHLLIDLGFTHLQATGVLALVNIMFITLAYFLRQLGSAALMIFLFGLAGILTGALFYLVYRKKRLENNQN
jgi:UDP-N-acetylmuramyl pentapeptide phosphotransferase/UDP-N-acetylglucosamine-1-phosphate transferase